MISENLAALIVAVLGVGLALVLGRAFLAAVLRATFHKARTVVRRLVDRRATAREDAERRQADRRQ